MKFTHTILGLIALSLLSACGGSGAATEPPKFNLATIVIGNPEWDGTAKDTGNGIMLTTDATVDAGDYFSGARVQALFTFDLDQIPEDVTILSATLSIYQYPGQGTPYVNHGDAVLDHIEYNPLAPNQFGIPAIQDAFAVFATDMTEGMHSADVAAQLQADVDDGKKRFQVRVRHVIQVLDQNGQDDSTKWSSADGAFADRYPRLVVVLAD